MKLLQKSRKEQPSHGGNGLEELRGAERTWREYCVGKNWIFVDRSRPGGVVAAKGRRQDGLSERATAVKKDRPTP